MLRLQPLILKRLSPIKFFLDQKHLFFTFNGNVEATHRWQ